MSRIQKHAEATSSFAVLHGCVPWCVDDDAQYSVAMARSWVGGDLGNTSTDQPRSALNPGICMRHLFFLKKKYLDRSHCDNRVTSSQVNSCTVKWITVLVRNGQREHLKVDRLHRPTRLQSRLQSIDRLHPPNSFWIDSVDRLLESWQMTREGSFKTICVFHLSHLKANPIRCTIASIRPAPLDH